MSLTKTNKSNTTVCIVRKTPKALETVVFYKSTYTCCHRGMFAGESKVLHRASKVCRVMDELEV